VQSFTQLSDNPGEELYPSLAPDAKSFIYQSRAAGKWRDLSEAGGRAKPYVLNQGLGI